MHPNSSLARRRKLALLEAECLVRTFGITRDELEAVQAELESRRAALGAQIAEAHRLMDLYGLSVADLLEDGEGQPRRIYKHPVSGESWVGSGPQPNWLKRALLQEGYRPSELLVPEDSAVFDQHDEGAQAFKASTELAGQ